MGDWWRRFRAWDEKGPFMHEVKGELAITRGGYVFDRRVFRVVLILFFGLLVWMIYTANVGHQEVYISCTGTTPCENQFYHNCDHPVCAPIVNQEILPPGFALGTPPSVEFHRQVKGLVLITVSLFILAFVVNHFLHNKGRSLNTIMPMEEEV